MLTFCFRESNASFKINFFSLKRTKKQSHIKCFRLFNNFRKKRKQIINSKSGGNKINNIRNLFIIKKEKKEIRNRIVEDKIIRDIWTPFETEEEKEERN